MNRKRCLVIAAAAAVPWLVACGEIMSVTSPDPVTAPRVERQDLFVPGMVVTANGDSTDDEDYSWGRIKFLFEDDGTDDDEDDCDCGDGPIEW